MDGTRASIIELLRQGDGLTVEALTESLGLAAATVRRHLDVLQRDGYVERQAVRRSTGRPHYAFTLTQAGRDLAPGHYVGVTELLLSELLALTEEDTRGKDGAAVALLAFERMNDALLRVCERARHSSEPSGSAAAGGRGALRGGSDARDGAAAGRLS